MDARQSPHPFGISSFISPDVLDDALFTTQDFQCLLRSGAGWIRWRFDRRLLHPTSDRFEATATDAWVDQCRAANIQILATLTGSLDDARSPSAFARFATTVVAHFKERIRHWEVWHEPDDAAYWPASDAMTSYSAFLTEVSAAIRAEDPSAVVHLAALSRRLPTCLKEIYQCAAKSAFDVVHMNPFVSPLMPDSVGGFRYFYDMVRRVMTAAGDADKPVWFSQVGAPGMKDPQAAPDWWLGKNPTEVVQEHWVRTVLSEPQRWKGVEKIFWTALRDHPGRTGHGHDFCGLVRPDFSPKPSFNVFRELAAGEVK